MDLPERHYCFAHKGPFTPQLRSKPAVVSTAANIPYCNFSKRNHSFLQTPIAADTAGNGG
jgi:hypothetical protein